MTRVSIVSPNHALRFGLREMLARNPGIQVIDDSTHLEDIDMEETEVVLMDPVSSDLELDPKINYLILFLTNDVESVLGILSPNVQAWGVLPTDSTEDELVAGVLGVGQGLWVGAPSLVEKLIRFPRVRSDLGEESLIEPLTAREKEVLQFMAKGLANKQIAVSLSISEHTVKFHLSSMYAKLGVSSRIEAIRRGIDLGLISL